MNKLASSQPRDIYAEITQKIIAAIEVDPGDPQLPWRRPGRPLWLPRNALTRKSYNGINVITLWAAAEVRGFEHSVWATYKQWAQQGCQVKRGAKAEMIVFYKSFETDPDPDVEGDDGRRRVARVSHVFNASDVDGFEVPPLPEPLPPIDRLEAADHFIRNTGIRIVHEGDRAFYCPSTDTVTMPTEDLFCGTDTMTRTEGYYCVLGHECCHATGHPTRLNRDLTGRFGSNAYAAEELVATIGEAFLCAELHITPETRPDHAQYLASWLRLLRNDRKAIFTAAARAAEAVQWLKDRQLAGLAKQYS